MRELYELTTLAFPLLSTSKVAKAARGWVSMPDAVGTLLGCWRTEIGPLGRMLILRRFDDTEALQRERHRALSSANPFNAGEMITALEMDSYMPFLSCLQRRLARMTLSTNSVLTS
jgi:NIPSNAP